MILKNGKRVTDSEMSEYLELTKKEFPKFFRDENPQAVCLIYQPNRIHKDDDGTVFIPPSIPIMVENTVTNKDGGRDVFRYAEGFTTVEGKETTHPVTVSISHRDTINPGRQNDLLVFLWLFSGMIANNACPASSKNNVQPHMFERLELDAAQKIEFQKKLVTAQARILGANALSESELRNVAKSLQMAGQSDMSEDMIRMALNDYVVLNSGQLDKFLRMSEMGDEYKLRLAIESAIEKKIIGFVKDRNGWYSLSEEGKIGSILQACRTHTDGERRQELINAITVDAEIRETFESLTSSTAPSGGGSQDRVKDSRDFPGNPKGIKEMKEYLEGKQPLEISVFFKGEVEGDDPRQPVVTLAKSLTEG